jgi:hypothetical protein
MTRDDMFENVTKLFGKTPDRRVLLSAVVAAVLPVGVSAASKAGPCGECKNEGGCLSGLDCVSGRCVEPGVVCDGRAYDETCRGVFRKGTGNYRCTPDGGKCCQRQKGRLRCRPARARCR